MYDNHKCSNRKEQLFLIIYARDQFGPTRSSDPKLEQLVNFPTREENTLDLILTSLPGQFQEVHSLDKLSDHDNVADTLKVFIPPRKKPRRKVYLYQKGDFDSIRRDSSNFAKNKNISMVILVLVQFRKTSF